MKKLLIAVLALALSMCVLAVAEEAAVMTYAD